MGFRVRRVWPLFLAGHKKQDSANQLNPVFVLLANTLEANYDTKREAQIILACAEKTGVNVVSLGA